ncbi:hypothetical protein [Aquabacterium sp.]|uniref:hypothetical protein n=1 Tax=Aquabacterium sp. TaxID=1872578 RepID=UPI0019ACE39A|nr:hypothetical protein [Aquabacterium sp.]MBC7702190.1 hypothetical protein [Aquabacterium sp.]
MLESEKFAIAAHLHVNLRRINGRVTDVEWMVKSPDYAREIIRVARTETHPGLLRLADKLEAALQPPMSAPRVQAVPPAQPAFVASQSGPPSGFSAPSLDPAASRKRYVGTLR